MVRATRRYIIGGGIFWLASGARSFAAPPAADAVSTTGGAGPSRAVATVDDKSFETLRNEVSELRRKVDKPPKDFWDKVTSVSGLASGLAVALIGFYATNVAPR